MNASRLGEKSLNICYALLLVVLVTFLVLAGGHFPGAGSQFDWIPFVLLFSIAFLWQVFTVYHHRRAFLAWILLIIYGTTALLFLIFGLR